MNRQVAQQFITSWKINKALYVKESVFWRYYTTDTDHKLSNKKDNAKLIHTPWWMMDEPAGK